MEVEVQTTNTYTVILDETEMLDLCEEISMIISQGNMVCGDVPTLHKLRTDIEANYR